MYARDHALIATPLGAIRVDGDDRRITGIRIGAEGAAAAGASTAVRMAAEQLEQWFAGERQDFALPLEPMSTPRGETLRAGLVAVPYGETMSYGALARQLGSAPRAIGQLCARNPFPVVVPCHRVLAGGGALGNYSGGEGPITKRWLLDHERRHAGGTLL
ncbi:methylated-DNA--[protein]-cysteine S-methyltransferase [Sphingomonas canadensis]|uniref:Methylated-DNA--[protein]-cysteine S-methyltransferase n=1 Tax=Sphingomonas canadensis TaxID=1219257 RepID=A0ABW3H185_9SPHN|nr:methylated-DNA--[protein]-cysteine S-methyltransferase [Sphingomonas canadensis]MCW3834897.1 methylated-DNA--[protein]-cysteine S-methyltransferase [Sphingomonas canadensis]